MIQATDVQIKISVVVVVDECETKHQALRGDTGSFVVTSLNVPSFSLCSSTTRSQKPTARSVKPSLS